MNMPVISVENLSKAYRLGLKEKIADTMVGAVTNTLKAPFRNWKTLQSLDVKDGGDSDDVLWALNDVSFDVREGEVVGIIGRNGAGKSTLLKVLSRITEPTSGCVKLRGRVSSLLEVGTGFHPELTGRDNIYMNGTILGMTKREIDGKFDEIVDFSGVEKFLDTPVKRYSSGMQVRLAFAVAAHLEPEILIVDEVLAVGDAEFQKKCIGKMQDVSHSGRTVLFVSHNMRAVKQLCNSAMWLSSGRIQARGAVEEVTSRYLCDVTPSATGRISVEHQSRPNDGVYATSCRIKELLINAGNPLLYGESCECQLEIISEDTHDAVAFAVGFCTTDGYRVLTIDSAANGASHSLGRGLYRARCELPRLDLEPGLYSLDVGLRAGGRAIDYVKGCGTTEVFPSASTPSEFVRNSGGGMRQCTEWILSKEQRV